VTTLLQISDPHFGTEQPPVVDALVRLAHALAPQVVVLSGDITQRATAAQFAAARAFVRRLPAAPLLAIPGNHDIPLFDLVSRVWRPYARYAAAFGALEGEWQSEALLVITLNTTRPRRRKDGEVSAAQIERVASRVAAAPASQTRVVVVHQPLAALDEQDRADLLHNRTAATRRWAEAGVDIVLGGHIHLPYVVPLGSRPMWVVQAGTAVSHRVRFEAGNSVNVLHAETPRHCRLRRYDWKAASGEFEPVAERQLR
jgi:3',5'-cyclic AMP phosphodiesterase CpdA